MVNQGRILDLLDQAREALPEDLVAADASSPTRTPSWDVPQFCHAETRIAEANSRSTLDQANERAAQILADAEGSRARSSRANDGPRLVSQARSGAEATIADAVGAHRSH